jgi:hypothetical protein
MGPILSVQPTMGALVNMDIISENMELPTAP